MTQKLYEMFKKKYPQEYNNFSIYGANERINVHLNDKIFIDKWDKQLINLNDLERFVKKYFEDFYEIKDCKDTGYKVGYLIRFNTQTSKGKEIFDKTKNYNQHSFWITSFTPPLEMEISTGNRGRSLLIKEQRNNYFNFVNGLFEKFKENALRI